MSDLRFYDEDLYKMAKDPSLEQFINTIITLNVKGNTHLLLSLSPQLYLEIQRCKRERYWVQYSKYEDPSPIRHATLLDLAYPAKAIWVPFYDADDHKDYLPMCETVILDVALKAAIHFFEQRTPAPDLNWKFTQTW